MSTPAETLAAQTLEVLARVGTHLGPALTEARLLELEREHAVRIPAELRALLSVAVPLAEGFTPWGDDDESCARRVDAFSWPEVGVLFDVEHNAFWLDAWGPRPAETPAAIARARRHMSSVPALVPVYGHRYLACEPELVGSPVLSVYQTDVILYGADLADWARCEFEKAPIPATTERCATPFWRDVIDGGARLSATQG